MEEFINNLRKLLGLGEAETQPVPHPLEAKIEQALQAAEKAIEQAAGPCDLATLKPLRATLAVLRLQYRQSIQAHRSAKTDKDKSVVTSVLEKLESKIEGVKNDATKAGEAGKKAKAEWRAMAKEFQETAKLLNEIAGFGAPEAGPLGAQMSNIERAIEDRRYEAATKELKALGPKVQKAHPLAAAKFDSTTDIEAMHGKYLSRKPIKSDNPLDDLEAKVNELVAIEEAITKWLSDHSGIGRPAIKTGQKTLAGLRAAVAAERKKVEKDRDGIRKGNQANLLDQIKKADAGERERLSKDKEFIATLERNLPPKALEYARKQLGMTELELEYENMIRNMEPDEDNILSDPKSYLGADFLEYLKFDTDKIEKVSNPELKKKVTVPGGVSWVDEGSGQKLSFVSDAEVDIVGTGPNGEIRFTYGGGKFGLTKKKVPLPSGGKVSLKETTHKRENTPLFPEPPSRAHIQQGGIADCFLLAAVTSLVAKDPGAIEDMMNDKGGTVTVRLFDVKENGDKKEFKARYFNIEKSVARDGKGNAQYADNSIWVQMLEKAYTAGGFTGSITKEALAKYENISFGHTSHAFEVLTGKPAKGGLGYIPLTDDQRKDFVATSVDEDTGTLSWQSLPWSTEEKAAYKGMTTTTDQFRQMVCWEIFGGARGLIHQWMIYVGSGAVQQLFDREFSGGYSGEVTVQDFVDLFKGKIKQPDGSETAVTPLNAKVSGPVLKWIRDNQLYPGARGTPDYSKLQLKMYTGIKEGLDKGKMVCLASKEKVGRVASGTGHSGGEEISGGLVGSHAYTVLKVKEGSNGLRSLLVRNPWGKTVQENYTAGDRLLEIDADPNIQEHDTNAPILAGLPGQMKANKEKLESGPAVSERIKLFAQKDVLQTQYSTLIKRQAEIEASDLYKERLELKKLDPTALLSKEAEKSSESDLGGGEFWLPLFDLTQRFNGYDVC